MARRKPPGETKEIDGDILDFLDEDTASLPGIKVPQRFRGEPVGNPHLVLMFGSSVGQVFELTTKYTVVGRDLAADVRLSDRAVSRRHLKISRNRVGWFVEDLGSRNGSYVNEQTVQSPVQLRHNDVIYVGANSTLKFVAPDGPDAKHTLALYTAATTDFLTGVYNRRYLEEMLVSELSFARRHKSPLALMLMDLDHFKQVNDTYGHQAGDMVLREFAELVKRSIRTEDHLGRYGGEEFAIIARATDVERGALKAERIRHTVEGHVFSAEQHPLRMTVSIGVAAFDGEESAPPKALIKALVASADTGVYQAKETGRNRVVQISELTDLNAEP